MSKTLRWVVVGWLVGVVLLVAWVIFDSGKRTQDPRVSRPVRQGPDEKLLTPEARERERNPRSLQGDGLRLWWDAIPGYVKTSAIDTGTRSNILHADYATAESCKKCHTENYESWSSHPHRWMNAEANESTIKGDFSGAASIEYLGGIATFYREGEEYRMRLEKEGTQREYGIEQTIGSRFFQYYIGRQLVGPEARGHKFYRESHVLPFGYWLEPQEWVPVVHVGDERPDGKRNDPFLAPPTAFPEYSKYSKNCSHCHTTIPFGDWLLANPEVVARHAPFRLNLFLSGYLGEIHPELWDVRRTASDLSDDQFYDVAARIPEIKSPDNTVNLGISCEACHLGSQAHAAEKEILPSFLPMNQHLFIKNGPDIKFGRTHDNVNWACGRCHCGNRPQFANGISTWNSTEYTDAMRGSCYSELRCIDCHNPHKGIGRKWTATADEDDARCLQCHDSFKEEASLVAHTHHPVGTAGSRCMNCHMPRLNEGMQDVVRTHTIFSPTNREMILSNHPNACNLCHSDQTIGWTTKYLGQWYNKTYPADQLAAAYPDPDQPVGVGWLQSENEAVRLVAAAAMTRNNDRWALAELLEALDDPYLLNRQFARRGLEKMLDTELVDYGYRFYMTPEERRPILAKLRSALLVRENDETSTE